MSDLFKRARLYEALRKAVGAEPTPEAIERYLNSLVGKRDPATGLMMSKRINANGVAEFSVDHAPVAAEKCGSPYGRSDNPPDKTPTG